MKKAILILIVSLSLNANIIVPDVQPKTECQKVLKRYLIMLKDQEQNNTFTSQELEKYVCEYAEEIRDTCNDTNFYNQQKELFNFCREKGYIKWKSF